MPPSSESDSTPAGASRRRAPKPPPKENPPVFENAFIGCTTEPEDTAVAGALGPAKVAWDRFLASLAQDHGVTDHLWKSYSAKYGWALRVLKGKRTIVWLSPGAGSFEVLFILGDRALQAAHAATLPQEILRALETAPKYPEGTGVRLRVHLGRMIPNLLKLAAIKLAN